MSPSGSENFFYSNLFIAIVTFVVGSFGIYLYYRQKKDSKKRLAKIIFLEIENAQEKLKEAKAEVLQNPDDPLPEHLYAMPTDTWSENKHLFVDDFTSSEWKSINDFYDLCETYDEAIRHNDARFALQEAEIRKNIHVLTRKYAVEYSEKILGATDEDAVEALEKEFRQKRNGAVEMLINQKYMYIYTPTKQNQIVKSCVENINVDLSHSKIGEKLEKLSKNKLKFF